MIDNLREQIQQGIDQLLGEVDRLRKALAALDPRAEKPPARKARTRKPPAAAPAATPKTGTPARARRSGQAGAQSARRTAPGATKAAVLAALSDGKALTAGEVAAKTGLGRATVSTTLSKLAKSGEVQKAERGYRRTAARGSAAPS